MATGRWTPCAPPASARTAPRASLRSPPGLRAGGGPANTGNDEEGWLASKSRQFREHWADEMDGAAMYRARAGRAAGEQREIFLELAKAEERHARHWAAKLVELGEPEPRPEEHRRGLKTRLVAFLARRFGPGAVLPLVERAEVADAGHYDGVPDATVAMATDERIHARVLAGLTPATARDRGTALDTMAREELGLNPDELGSPWGVAVSSFVSFAVGAVVPVLPWLVAGGAPPGARAGEPVAGGA